MLLCLVNKRAVRIVKLPKPKSTNSARTTKAKVNAVAADASLEQRISNESL